MHLKLKDLSQDQVMKIATEHGMEPAFAGQNPYRPVVPVMRSAHALYPMDYIMSSCWIKKK